MIDTHAHLFLSELDPDLYISNAQRAGVTRIVCVATEIQNAGICMSLARRYPMVSATVGVHPCEPLIEDELELVRQFALANPVVAIGEIGLDGYRSPLPMADQICRFSAQMALARALNLPAIIHCRQAAEPMVEAISEFNDVLKVFHCFSEDAAFIAATATPTTYFSFTGNVTYDNARNSRHAATTLPIDRIMLETDAPYLTPTAYKGKANESGYLREMAVAIADLRGMSVADVMSHTTENAMRFFNFRE